MKQLIIFIIISLLLTSAGQCESKSDCTKWEGVLKVSGFELKLIFKLDDERCLLEVPAQALVDYPSSEYKMVNDSINITFSGMVHAGFIGVNQADTLIVGIWVQMGKSYPLILKKKVEYKRPQNPKPPLPYKVAEVSYFNQDKSIRFVGTLTIPEKGTKHPVAILITGSGQEDRDETVFGHKPFLVIADYLTRSGIAVLRVDDRGVGQTTGRETLKNATSYDFAMDVTAGIEYLKGRAEINPKKIGLIGHSEGGLIASIIGSRRNDLAFIVSLAGVGITGKELTLSQIRKSLQRAMSPTTIDSVMTFETKAIEIIMEEKDDRLAELAILQELMGAWINRQDTLVRKYFGMELIDGIQSYNTKEISKRYKGMMLPWFRYFLAYNPEKFLPKVEAPFLALNGEKDTQVLANLNSNGIDKIFKSCGKTNYKVIIYPELNHFFQHCKIGYIDEVEVIEETISQEVLNDMSDWINEQVGKGNITL